MNTGDPASSLFISPPPPPFPSPSPPHATSAAPPLSTSSSFSLPSSSSFASLPVSPSLSGSSQSQILAPDVDLSSIYPVSPFDSVCLKHMRRYLQGYDRVYTKMLMEYGAERSRVNQQHWERVHRLQQQQQQKVQRFHREQSHHDSSTASKGRHEEESKTREEEDGADAGDQQLDFLSPPHDTQDDEKAASMRQHKAEASAAEREQEREQQRERERREMSDAELAAMESEYREMKAELDAFHTACLSDANRRFRSMIISLTQRVDHFLSTLVSPSQLLQDVDVTLHVRSAATGRVLTAQFAVRCVETFSDLRRRFVHWMREEQGDAVLAFTPDSQFLLPHGEVNASCRTNIQHCFTRQQPQHHPASSSSSSKQQSPLRPPAAPAHVDSAHHSAYQSLSRPLAAFRARATRARAGYALKISGVEEESSAAGSSADAQHRGSGTVSTLLSPPSPQSIGTNSSRSGHSVAASSSFSVSAADAHSPSASGLPASASWSSPSSSFSSSPVMGPVRPPSSSSSSPLPSWPILILDEDIALVNFIADGVTSLTVDLLGAVVLVSDQAANASRATARQRRGAQQPVTPLAHSNYAAAPPTAASAQPSSSSSSSFSSPSSTQPPPVPYHLYPSRALGSIAASASRLPARILPNVRQHLAAAPPLPKLPPAITAFFHRHAHPHSSSSPPHAPDTPVAAAASARDAAGDAARTPTSWDAVLVEAAGADSAAAAAAQVGDRVPPSPPAELTVSSASEDSGSSEDSVQHVSLTHSVSLSTNPIDDADEMDEELMANNQHLMQQQQQQQQQQQLRSSAGTLQQQQQQQQQQQHLRPPLRARHHSHPLAFPTAASASASASASPSIPSMSRYAHHRLSVEVEADAADRIDSVAPSQSFSGVSIPFIDYDMEAEDSRLAERSVTETESSSVRMHDELDDDDDSGINTTGGSTGGVRGGRLRSQYGSSADASAEAEMNGTRLQHSHSFSHSSSQSTPPSALPTPSVSRPQSATLDLLSAGVLHLPRSQPPALPSSLRSSTGSPFPLTTSPPASLHALNPLMMSPSPNDSSTFLQPLSTDSRRSQ